MLKKTLSFPNLSMTLIEMTRKNILKVITNKITISIKTMIVNINLKIIVR